MKILTENFTIFFVSSIANQISRSTSLFGQIMNKAQLERGINWNANPFMQNAGWSDLLILRGHSEAIFLPTTFSKWKKKTFQCNAKYHAGTSID